MMRLDGRVLGVHRFLSSEEGEHMIVVVLMDTPSAELEELQKSAIRRQKGALEATVTVKEQVQEAGR